MKGARILLVDDEPSVVRFVGMALEQSGFVVEGARDAAEAIALADRRLFDAVVLDFRLPGLDGAHALAEIRKAQPGIAAIFSSGQISPVLIDHAARLGARTLEKPYRISALVGALADILRRP
ncbi:MAG TPA: response regulator [Myxococcales bacterium]|nr:response regulator [Myxococcales bacterium]